MSFSSKYARASEWFYFDFSAQLAPGDSITSLIEIAQEVGDCVISNQGLVGVAASLFVEEGTPESTCVLRALVTTAAGETLEIRDMFKIV